VPSIRDLLVALERRGGSGVLVVPFRVFGLAR
jgi:hypothetical protein